MIDVLMSTIFDICHVICESSRAICFCRSVYDVYVCAVLMVRLVWFSCQLFWSNKWSLRL